MVRSVRIGISGFVIALIVSGVWFVVTNQAAKISERAGHASFEYVASQRAVSRGMSVEEMKRTANEECYKSFPEPRRTTGYWFGGASAANTGITAEDCEEAQVYGGFVDPVPSIFVGQWIWAVAVLFGYSAFAGLALTAASEFGPLGFKVWWNWLTK